MVGNSDIICQDLSRSTHLMKQFGLLYKLATLMPEWIVSLVHPLTKDLFELRRNIASKVQASHTSNENQKYPKSIFDGLLESNLPSHELGADRLTDEGLTLIGAGTVTTAHTLTTILFHLLANPASVKNLREELSFLPGNHTWSALSQLPYLSAIVNEGLRLSYGVSHRLQRISPDQPLPYKQWVIPAGTPVSMTNMFIHQDPEIFPDPNSFCPERWLESASWEPSKFPPPQQARRFLVPFSKGTRACLGMNLAYAELFLVLGSLFRPVEQGGLEMELFKTSYEDVECVHDFFNPAAKLNSPGVRVIVR